MAYEPGEDSELLRKYVGRYAFGKVLDVGTGSGIQAIEAGKKKNVKSVLAVDIDGSVVKELKNKKLKKIKVKKSDLFSQVKGKFDTVIFNPPYLPQDKGIEDKALYGGKRGYKVLERFLNAVNEHLTEGGIILIVFSSLTNKEKINGILEKNLLAFKELEKQHIFFEDLFVYKIWKSDILKELNKKNIRKITYFSQGKRGVVFTGVYRGKKVAVKVKRKESKAIQRIKNEVKWLKILNKKNIGPKLLFYGNNYLIYGFVEGEFILDYLGKRKDKKLLVSVLKQCFIMDRLGVNKEEMHRPVKHIIVNKEGKATLIDAGRSKTSGISKTAKAVLIDFERCYKTKRPHNVTQFGVFLMRHKLAGKKMIDLLKNYKKEMSKNNFNEIIKAIKLTHS